jgi:hypothetical protein
MCNSTCKTTDKKMTTVYDFILKILNTKLNKSHPCDKVHHEEYFDFLKKYGTQEVFDDCFSIHTKNSILRIPRYVFDDCYEPIKYWRNAFRREVNTVFKFDLLSYLDPTINEFIFRLDIGCLITERIEFDNLITAISTSSPVSGQLVSPRNLYRHLGLVLNPIYEFLKQ